MNRDIDRPAKKDLIRSMNRKGVRSDMSPPVVKTMPRLREPAVCEKCGAVYLRKTWRRPRALDPAVLDRAMWTICPGCEQLKDERYQGRVLVTGSYAAENLDAIRKRIENVQRRAMATQPERRIVSMVWDRGTLEILTTSQKLAHRIVRELEKAFGGKVAYKWSGSDGSLFATWQHESVKEKGKAGASKR